MIGAYLRARVSNPPDFKSAPRDCCAAIEDHLQVLVKQGTSRKPRDRANAGL